jgi:hypothetical protein
MSIRVSEKHGVNPSVGQCFWCGEDDGTVVLLGRLPGDAEAPRRVCTSYEPCAKCQEQMTAGITVYEVSDRPAHDGQREMQRDVYPTGRWLVVTEDWALRKITPQKVLDRVLAHRAMLVDPEMFGVMTAHLRPAHDAEA